MAIPTNGLVFYAPLAEDKATAETGQTLTKTGTVNTLKINNIPCSLFASENSNLYANYSGGAFNGTISLWLYATDNTRSDTTDYGGFFMLGDFGNFSFIKGCMNTSAENSFSFGSSNINSSHCYPSTTIIRNEWVHLCFVVSGTSYSIYKNGILASQATAASAITLPDEATLYINNSEVGGIENIAIAACRVYNRVLTNDEITELSKEFADEGTSGGTGVVINGLFLSTSKPTANQKGLLVNNKFFIPFAESSGSGGTSAEYYKCASVDTEAKTWSGYKAVFDSTAGMWSFESDVTEGLAYTSVTPIVGGIYSADALIKISSMWNGVPSENLVFYLPLSETTIADVGPELTASGTIVHTVMNGIQCAYFNGSSYLRASAVSMPTGASPRALSLWFKYKDIPGATSSDAAVFAGWGTTISLGRFDAYVEAKELYIIYSSVALKTDIKIQDTNWHHVLLQYDGSTSEIYYDGQLAASEAKTLDTKNNYLYVGARENGEYAFDGYLAGIRIYNRAMTGTEIAYLASEFTPTT